MTSPNIESMTGFGKGEVRDDNYSVNVEIKTVNHRFKDVRFKMSSMFNSIELGLKEEINANFTRGSFDIYVNFKRLNGNQKFDDIDTDKIDAFMSMFKKIQSSHELSMNLGASDFLRAEFQKDKDSTLDPALESLTKQAFTKSIENLKQSRLSEGKKMVDVLKSHMNAYQENFKVVEDNAGTFQEHIKEKLLAKFKEHADDINIEESRFLQEVVYFLEKMDVHEEINRINSHISKLKSLLTGDKREVGRQIDFLVQELNRETNTVGSKSSMKDISNSVVNMKVELEKIREQALNIQ